MDSPDQNYLVQLKQAGSGDDFLLLLEHYPVFTIGKAGSRENILDQNISVTTTNRGGDITYHGPGQLVGYVILDLKFYKFDLHSYVSLLENTIIKVLQKLDIDASTNNRLRGVWVDGKKIASLGIAVKRGITMHGVALNIDPDPVCFSKINPCGLKSDIMTSIRELSGKSYCREEVEEIFIEMFLSSEKFKKY